MLMLILDSDIQIICAVLIRNTICQDSDVLLLGCIWILMKWNIYKTYRSDTNTINNPKTIFRNLYTRYVVIKL